MKHQGRQVKHLLLAITASAAVAAVSTHAQDVVLDPVGRGTIKGNNTHSSSYTRADGSSAWYVNESSGRFRPFFVFDIPPAPAGQYIASASLRLKPSSILGSPEDNSPLTVHILNVDSPVSDLENRTAQFEDLGDGPSFGSRVYLQGTDQGQFSEIPLNDLGVSTLNRATGVPYALSLNTINDQVIWDENDIAAVESNVGFFGDRDPSFLDDGHTQLLITWGGGPDAPKGSIGDTVYDDHNANGVQDPGEPGLAGVTVYLDVNADGSIDATTTTDANGHYLFPDLTPGLQYQVQVIKPVDYEFIQPTTTPYVKSAGTFTESFLLPLVSVPGDFNGDGELDVFSLNAKANLDARQFGSIVYGYGDGRFTVPTEVILSEDGDYTGGALAVADFNNDGLDDVAVGYSSFGLGSKVEIWLSDPVNGLSDPNNPFVSASVGNSPFVIRTGDLNDDTYPDLVIYNDIDRSVDVLLFDGSLLTPAAAIPGLLQPGEQEARIGSVALGDFNNDTILDLLIGTSVKFPGDRASTRVNLSVLLGDGTGGFGAPSTITAAEASGPDAIAGDIEVRSVEVGDFNDDGNLDGIVTTWSGNPSDDNLNDDPHPLFVVAFGDGNGNLENPQATRTVIGPGANQNFITVAELNGDSYPDLVDYHGFVFYGDGTGHFQFSDNAGRLGDTWLYRTIDERSILKGPVAVGDFNGDGGPDLIAPALFTGADGNQSDGKRSPDTVQQPFLVPGYGRDGLSRVVTLGPGEAISDLDQGLGSMRIDLEKFVNGDPANDPGDPLPLSPGDPVLYTYVIQNLSDFTLGTTENPLTLVDDNGTPLTQVDDLFYSVTDGVVNSSSLTLTGGDDGDGLFNPGETWTLAADAQTAEEALVTNTAQVFVGTTQRAVDTASYLGGEANRAPVAKNNDYTVEMDGQLVVTGLGVLDNDSDPDGDSISVVETMGTTANGGEYWVFPDGSFTYTPAIGFVGVDAFTYQITDGDLTSQPATVSITVIGEGQFIQDGRTIGYWSNNNGEADLAGEDLAALLAGLPLAGADGYYVAISNHADLRQFLLTADSKNGAHMLSAQMLATFLNVYVGYVDQNSVVDISLVTTLSGRNLAALADVGVPATDTVGNLVGYAVAYLAASSEPVVISNRDKAFPEALMKILDAINNNQPVFVAP